MFELKIMSESCETGKCSSSEGPARLSWERHDRFRRYSVINDAGLQSQHSRDLQQENQPEDGMQLESSNCLSEIRIQTASPDKPAGHSFIEQKHA